MSDESGRAIKHKELLRVAPSALNLDPVRPVGWRDVDDQLVTSVEEVDAVENLVERHIDSHGEDSVSEIVERYNLPDDEERDLSILVELAFDKIGVGDS